MENELPSNPSLSVVSPSEAVAVPLAPPLAPITAAPSFTDRSTGLVIFGVVQILLGLFASLMIPFVALGAFMSRLAPGGAMRPGQYLSGIVTYAFIAAVLICLGIGSIQAKRWAHALTLVTSWYALIMGALITILMTAMLPVMVRSVVAQAQKTTPTAATPLSTGAMAVVLTLVIVFAAFFLIIVPIAFVIFYGRRDVAETCRHRDPVERWTDRAPLPVLAASIILFVGGLYLFLTGISTPMFPLLGRYVTGLPGAACFFALGAIDIYLAFPIFRRQPFAWWIAILTLTLRSLSLAITYARADMMRAYAKVGFSDAQINMLRANPMFRGHIIFWWSLLAVILFYGYMLWLKRYFKAANDAPPLNAFPMQTD